MKTIASLRVFIPAILGIFAMQALHVLVPVSLGEYAGSGYRSIYRVALHHALMNDSKIR